MWHVSHGRLRHPALPSAEHVLTAAEIMSSLGIKVSRFLSTLPTA
ncbi:MAG: hypothetical protein KatS3mg125_0809 [Lysobacterales bacterium]|jgi:hypothetical protein|nr:MAG: hypothetical protein KatS3mg125_0809 [Xanthomonadales bacterium]